MYVLKPSQSTANLSSNNCLVQNHPLKFFSCFHSFLETHFVLELRLLNYQSRCPLVVHIQLTSPVRILLILFSFGYCGGM